MSKITDVPFNELEQMVKESISYAEVLRKLGYREKGGRPWTNLKKRLVEFKIDTSHFKGRAHGTSKTQKYELEEILIENSTYTNLYRLKKRLVKENILEYKCAVCGISDWLGKDLTLQLDHINGINTDHRLENIRFLCPNCHSQTDTYCGRNVNYDGDIV